jgi:nitrogen regulatory protein PII
MKFVIAIIKPFKLEEVREALGALGIQGITAALSAASGIPLSALMGTGQKTEGGEAAADAAVNSDPSKYEGVA